MFLGETRRPSGGPGTKLRKVSFISPWSGEALWAALTHGSRGPAVQGAEVQAVMQGGQS